MKFSRSAYFTFILITYLILVYPSYAEKVDNIDKLVLLNDVVQCKACHKEHGAEWPESAHSGSVSDFRTLKAFKRYIEFNQTNQYETPGIKLRDDCFTCHAPRVKNASDSLLEEISGLMVTAVDYQGTLKGNSALNELSKISIDCAVCHMINGMPEGEVEPNMLYGPGWDAHHPDHTRDHGFDNVESPYLMTSEMCTRCHKDWLAGVPSIVKKLHKNSQSHFMEANSINKTCQSCHMMDGNMIIHNMPVYSGTLKFPVEQTADRIGTTMALMTFLGIFLNVVSIAVSRRRQGKRAIGVELGDSVEIMPAINTDQLFPHQAEAATEEEENNNESEEHTTG